MEAMSHQANTDFSHGFDWILFVLVVVKEGKKAIGETEAKLAY